MKKLLLLILLICQAYCYGQIISPNGDNLFYYNGNADVTFRFMPRGSGGRAMVHETGNILAFNYDGDFSGGTKFGSNFLVYPSGKTLISNSLNTNDYTNAGQHQGQVRITNNQGAYGSRALEIALLDNGTGVIQANEFNVGYNNLVLNPVHGLVGVGTVNPDQKLTIKGGGIGFDHISQDKKLYSPADGTLEWMTNSFAGEHGFAVSHQGDRRIYLNISGNSYINGGNVGIGTTTPKEKLSVNGKIRAHEVKVETANWPDYVFEEGYKPKSLQEIDEFIKLNKHLPEVPSAKEVTQNGIELGEMNKILLKKIEELTLHLIAKDKAYDELLKRIEKLEKDK